MTNEADKPSVEGLLNEFAHACHERGIAIERQDTGLAGRWLTIIDELRERLASEAAPAAPPATPLREVLTQANVMRLMVFAQHGQPKGYAASDMMRADLEALILAASSDEDRKLMAVVEAAKEWHEADVDNDAESLIAELKLHEALQHLKGERP